MKRKSLIILLCLWYTFLLVACGKTEEERELQEIAEELDLTDEDIQEIKNDLLEDESYEDEKSDEQKQENKMDSYIKFDAVEKWKDTEIYDMAVQIDDQLYVGGCTVKDIVDQIESSEIEYSHDINLDKLIQSHEDESLIVFRDGVEWFEIESFNFSEEIGKLADNVVMCVVVKQNAYPYSRFIDGRSYDEILELSYEDVITLQDSLFSEDIWDYSEQSSYFYNEPNEKVDVFVEKYAINSYEFVQPDFLWTGYDIGKSESYIFYVNCDTGKVDKFEQLHSGFRYVETEAIQYMLLSDITEEELKEFISVADKVLEENFDAAFKELDTIYLSDYSGGHCLYFSYKIVKGDGSEKYAYVEFIHAGHKPIGGIGYQNMFYDERDLSEGMYEVKDSLARTLLDKIEYEKIEETFSDTETKFEYWDSLSDITEEEMNGLILDAEKILEKELDAVSKELHAIYLYEQSGGFCLGFSYKITKEDDSEKYANVNLSNIGYKSAGGMDWHRFSYGECDLSEGVFKVEDAWGIRLVDKIEYAN